MLARFPAPVRLGRARFTLPLAALSVLGVAGCVSDDGAAPAACPTCFDASLLDDGGFATADGQVNGMVDSTAPNDAADATLVDSSMPVEAGDASQPGDAADGGTLAPDASDGSDSAPPDATDSSSPDSSAPDAADAASPDAADAALTYPEVVEADDPLAYWRFGESAGTVATDQMGTTNGSYQGGVTLGAPGAIAGDSDTAATFDGATGYVDMGSAFAFGGTAAMSYEAWVKPGVADAAARRFLSKETSSGGLREGYLMAYSEASVDGGAVLSWERWGNGTDSTGAIVTIGVYNHVVVTYDGATMAMYLNGTMVGSSPSTRSIATLTDSFRVATYSDFLSASDCFPGTIDEVAIYDHALPAASVALHYHVGSGK